MARLHEPSAPLESLDVLRKRFLRQNKEIIRINADQAAKIRLLEAETSRLLSENITLREENIQLTHQLEQGRHALALENVGTVKDKLQTFAAGLSDLLSELAEAQRTLPDTRPYHTTPKRRSPKASARACKPATDQNEPGASHGGLSPIAENVSYPIHSLHSNDPAASMLTSPLLPSPGRARLSNHASPALSSPDLGPPPVMNFDLGDPSKQQQGPTSPSPTKTRSPGEDAVGQDQGSWPLPPNLETRKKRRTSSFRGDHEQSTGAIHNDEAVNDRYLEDSGPSEQPVKASGKRKFSFQDEEQSDAVKASSTSREQNKTVDAPVELPIRQVQTDAKVEKNAKRPQAPSLTENKNASRHVGRRALGEKAVNTDPVISPAKAKHRHNRDTKGNFDKLSKQDVGVFLVPNKTVKASQTIKAHPSVPHRTHSRQNANHREIHYVEARTFPAPEAHNITPPSKAHSDRQNELLSLDDDPVLSGADFRPSRRSRPTISYAEPNLRDKMRRPTKDLVDAVTGEGKSSRLSSNFATDDIEFNVNIPDHLSSRKSLVNNGPSSLSSTELTNGDPIKLTTISDRRKRRSVLVDHQQGVSIDKKSNLRDNDAGGYSGRAKDRSDGDVGTKTASIETGREPESEQAIFDVLTSSPDSVKTGSGRTRRRASSAAENAKKGGGSRRGGGRRRDTMDVDVRTSNRDLEADAYPDVSEVDSEYLPERATTRRRSMML